MGKRSRSARGDEEGQAPLHPDRRADEGRVGADPPQARGQGGELAARQDRRRVCERSRPRLRRQRRQRAHHGRDRCGRTSPPGTGRVGGQSGQRQGVGEEAASHCRPFPQAGGEAPRLPHAPTGDPRRPAADRERLAARDEVRRLPRAGRGRRRPGGRVQPLRPRLDGEVRRGARRLRGAAVRLGAARRRDRRLGRRRQAELLDTAGGVEGRRAAALFRLRPARTRRRGSGRPASGRTQGQAGDAARGGAAAAALLRARPRRRRSDVRRAVRARLRGRRQQARRRQGPPRPLGVVAQGQVHPPPGVRHRRLVEVGQGPGLRLAAARRAGGGADSAMPGASVQGSTTGRWRS